MNNLTYLFVAYTLIWLTVFGYVISLHLGQKQLRKRIDILTELAKRRGASEPDEAAVEPRGR